MMIDMKIREITFLWAGEWDQSVREMMIRVILISRSPARIVSG